MSEVTWRAALSKTKQAAFGRLATVFGATELTDSFWDALEETLIQADLGIRLTSELLDSLKNIANQEGILEVSQLKARLRNLLLAQLPPGASDEYASPQIIVVVGVNGSGKTTVAARLARAYQQNQKQPLLAAADTYRAAAKEQLERWAQQLEVEVIAGRPGSDPGAVVYDASQALLARGLDVLIIDTSGRMHTHRNLMAELQKICRVAGKVIPDSPHQILLVLDATTGQNGLSQAKSFTEAIPVTGVVLAKLDSSARGGVGFAVASNLGLPIQYVGLGEDLDAFAPFKPEAFVDGLLA